jgi:ankyrin repeat protein
MWWSKLYVLVSALFLQCTPTVVLSKKIDFRLDDLFAAVATDDPAVVRQTIVSYGADINQKGPGGQTPLINAILTGKANAVKVLLELGADYTIPEKDGYTVFHAAAFQGRAEIVHLLAQHTDENGQTPIQDRFLLERHKDGFIPMHRACWGRETRHSNTVQAFLALGVPHDAPALNGITCAIMTKNQATQAILQQAEAEAKAKDETNDSGTSQEEL